MWLWCIYNAEKLKYSECTLKNYLPFFSLVWQWPFFSIFFVTFFFRFDVLVGVIFVGCFFAIVLFFSQKKGMNFPWCENYDTFAHLIISKKKTLTFFIQDIVYVRIFYGLLRRKRYLSVIFSTFLTAVHLRKVRVYVS